MENFQRLVGSSKRAWKRSRCSSWSMDRKTLTMVVPLAARCSSKALIWS